VRQVVLTTNTHGLFEPLQCPGEIPLTQRQQASAPRGKHQTCRVCDGLGNLEPVFPEPPACGKAAEFGVTVRQLGTGKHRRHHDFLQTLITPLAFQEGRSVMIAVKSLTIFALCLQGYAEVLTCQRCHKDVFTGRGHGKGTLRRSHSLVVGAHVIIIDGQQA
jgi:hypothetical protein